MLPQLTFLLGGPVPQQQSPRTIPAALAPHSDLAHCLLFSSCPGCCRGKPRSYAPERLSGFALPFPLVQKKYKKTAIDSFFWSARHHLPSQAELNTAAQLHHLPAWSYLSLFRPKQLLPQSFCFSLSLSGLPAFLPPRKLWNTTAAEMKRKKSFQPTELISTPLLQGRDTQRHFLYLPPSNKSEEDNHPTLPSRPFCDPPPSWI